MADNVEVRGLELQIKANASQAVSSLNELSGVLKGLTFGKRKAENMRKMADEVVRFSETLKGTVPSSIAKLAGFADAINSLSNIKKPNLPKGVDTRVAEIAKAFDAIDPENLTTRVKGFADALTPLSEIKIGITGKSGSNITSFVEAINSVDTTKLATSATATATALKPLADMLYRVAEGMKNLPNGVVIGALARISKESTKTTTKVNHLSRALKNLKSIGSGLGKIGGIVMPFKGLGSAIAGAKKKADNLLSSLKRIAFYRAIRSFIKSITDGFKVGTENLYYYSQAVGTKFAPALDLLATDLLYLRNSIGAATSPIIEELAPAIDYATDKIVDMINAVNMLLSKLTGKSQWTKALKYPAKYAEETKNATKAAKDYLLEFDELHVLDDKSGGRGSDALDYTRMFEEQDLDQSFASWVDDFKDAISKGDWEGAGAILGSKIDTAIKSINPVPLANDLTNKVNNVVNLSRGLLGRLDTSSYGSGLATFLNTAITNLNEKNLGDLMGMKVQKIVEFAFGFVTTFDWENAGVGATDFLKGYFEAVDGEKVGETLSTTIKGALTTVRTIFSDKQLISDLGEDISGFLNGVDWYGVIHDTLITAGAIASAVFSLLHDIVVNTDWARIGSDIASGVVTALSEIDWAQMLTDITDIINAIFTTAANAANEILGNAGSEFGKVFSIALYGGYFDATTGDWVDIKQQSLDMAEEIASFATSALVTATLHAAQHAQGVAFHEWAQNNIPGLSATSGTAYSNLLSSMATSPSGGAMPTPTNNYNGYGVFDMLFHIPHSGKHELTETMEYLLGVFDDLTEDVRNFYNPLGILSNSTIIDILNGNTIIKGNRNVRAASKGWKDYASSLNATATSTKELSADTTTLDTSILTMSEGVVTPLENFKKSFDNAKDGAVTDINTVKTSTTSAINTMNSQIATPLTTFKNLIVNTFSNAKSESDTKFKGIKDSTVSAINDTKKNLSSPLDQLKNAITGMFTSAKTVSETNFKGIKDKTIAVINNTKKDLSTPLNNLKSSVTGAFTGMQNESITALNGNGGKGGIHDRTITVFTTINTDVKTPVNNIKDSVVNGFMNIETGLTANGFVDKVTSIFKSLRTNTANIFNNIIGAGETLANGISTAFNNVAKDMNGYKLTLPKEFGGGTVQFSIPTVTGITIPRIPAMAQGGLVASPTTALIGEAGREAVMPLDNNTEWMDMLASRLVVGMSGSTIYDANDRPIQVHVELDGREIYQNQEKVRRSIGYNVGGGAFA